MIGDNHTSQEKKLIRQTILEIREDISDVRMNQGDLNLHKFVYDKIKEIFNKHLKSLE